MIIQVFPARRKIKFWKKLSPFWWFGNEDDGWHGDDKWRAGREKTLLLALIWFFRNPMHNFTFYVIGISDYPRTFYSNKLWGKADGFSFHYTPTPVLNIPLPMVAYVGKKIGWYIGWRPYGSFGISLNFAGSYIAARNKH